MSKHLDNMSKAGVFKAPVGEKAVKRGFFAGHIAVTRRDDDRAKREGASRRPICGISLRCLQVPASASPALPCLRQKGGWINTTSCIAALTCMLAESNVTVPCT